jgi:hypothetical protein
MKAMTGVPGVLKAAHHSYRGAREQPEFEAPEFEGHRSDSKVSNALVRKLNRACNGQKVVIKFFRK